ncbi:MAG: BACON domain-containing protein [Bacteroidales bacterium]|nr:BACON domain-containing protein [Bacteroidales bacterium]
MKRSFIVSVVLSLFMTGCSLIEMILPEVDVLKLSETEFVIPSKGGEFFLDITYTGEYTLNIETDGDAWLHEIATRATNTDEGILRFRVDANKGYDDRHARIEVSVSPKVRKYINVTQKQKDALMLSKDIYELDEKGGSLNIEVQANVDVAVEIDPAASEWLSQVETKALVSKNFGFRIDPYEGSGTRSGKIFFTSGDIKEEVTVYQNGGPELVLGSNLVNLTSEEGVFTVDVTTNVEYEVVMPEADWLSYVPTTRGAVTGSLEFKVKENLTYDSREAVIMIKGMDCNLSETVRVVQSQKDAIVPGVSSVELESGSGTFSLTLGSNVDYDLSIDADWLSHVQTKAFVEKELQFAYEANEAPDDREAVITFVYGDIIQKVKVVQSALLKDYVLKVIHTNRTFRLPEFTGTLKSGTVDWGDGSQEGYSAGLGHDYGTGSEVTVEMDFNAGAGEHLVKFDDIEGIVEIDLSGM